MMKNFLAQCKKFVDERKSDNSIAFLNGIVVDVTIRIVGRFANAIMPCVVIKSVDGCYKLFDQRCFTKTLGIFLRTLYLMLKSNNCDEPINLIESLKGTPVRLIVEKAGTPEQKIIGMANFLSDDYFVEQFFVEHANKQK